MSSPPAYASGRPRRSTVRLDLASPEESTPKRTRTPRALHRKTDHSVIERRRRERINDRLVCLQHTVPACRENAREHLRKKALLDESDEAIDERIASEMVLEKLCIISHTVDYVMELRAQLEAYRQYCRCSPPLPDTAPNAEEHCRFAHTEEQRGCVRRSNSGSSTCSSPETDEKGKDDLLPPMESKVAMQPPPSLPSLSHSLPWDPRHAHLHVVPWPRHAPYARPVHVCYPERLPPLLARPPSHDYSMWRCMSHRPHEHKRYHRDAEMRPATAAARAP